MDPEEKELEPERKRTDDSLRIERARTDVELAGRLRVIEADAAGEVDRARENADHVLEASRDEADHRLTGPGERAPADDTIAEARAQEDAALQHERAAVDEKLHRDREEHVRVLLRLLPLEREKTDQYLLTERARSDEAISNRDDFLSIVSHDLRNLLNSVSMGAQLIEQYVVEKGEENSTWQTARRIQRVAVRMNRLIGDLVDVSSIESGRLAVTLAPGDAAALITEALDAFRSSTSAKRISLESEGVGPSLFATFDHDRVLQVLANLIGNSIKFTPPDGQIRVGCARAGDDVRLSVRDTGPGIPEGQLEAVFERFWQVGENDRRGLGLGLYISKGIIEAQGGRIWAESRLGEGSTFYFTLPAATPAVDVSTTATPVARVATPQLHGAR